MYRCPQTPTACHEQAVSAGRNRGSSHAECKVEIYNEAGKPASAAVRLIPCCSVCRYCCVLGERISCACSSAPWPASCSDCSWQTPSQRSGRTVGEPCANWLPSACACCQACRAVAACSRCHCSKKAARGCVPGVFTSKARQAKNHGSIYDGMVVAKREGQLLRRI